MPDIVAARPVSGAPVETGWGGQVHDLVEGIQAGSVSVAGFSATVVGTTPVVFPRPYASPPTIHLSISSNVCAPGYGGLTATGFNALAHRTDGNASLTTQTVWWVAIGTPA